MIPTNKRNRPIPIPACMAVVRDVEAGESLGRGVPIKSIGLAGVDNEVGDKRSIMSVFGGVSTGSGVADAVLEEGEGEVGI